MKKDALISFFVSLVFAIFWTVISYVRYNAWQGSLATFVVMFLLMFVLLMSVFVVSGAVYKHKIRKMEQLADQYEKES